MEILPAPFALLRQIVGLLLVSAGSLTCFADSIGLASGAGETKNNSTSSTINITPNASWDKAYNNTSWISVAQMSGRGSSGDVTFTDNFTVDGVPTFSDLLVMADEKLSVSLNGVLLVSDLSKCSHLAIGYTNATEGILDLTNALRQGNNTLTFTLERIGGSSFGLDYSGVVVSEVSSPPAVASPSPEPGTLLLFGVPLALLGLLRRRKLRARNEL